MDPGQDGLSKDVDKWRQFGGGHPNYYLGRPPFRRDGIWRSLGAIITNVPLTDSTTAFQPT